MTPDEEATRDAVAALIERAVDYFAPDDSHRVGIEAADALIAAGQVSPGGTRSTREDMAAVFGYELGQRDVPGSTHGLTDDEVLALSATAKALSRRIDTVTALCDRADEFGRVMVGPIRRALTDQEGDTDG